MNREQWLCDQLDGENLSDALRTKYEAELDQIAARHTISQDKAKIAKDKKEKELAEIRAKILAQDEDFIKSFGEQEFGDDYDVVQEGSDFVVYSKVARDDQEHRRVHPTLDAANGDLRYLFYNRLYDRYVRGGEMDNLVELVNE